MAKKSYFRNPLAEFIYLRTYARWLEDKKRREHWPETVERYMAFMREKMGTRLSEKEYHDVKNAILHQHVMPSMRLMQFAGKAAEQSEVCTYNCAYIAPQSLSDLAEIMYITMCGVGVGFSVETNTVAQFPMIKQQKNNMLATCVIKDTREGWCKAFLKGLKAWYAGNDIEFNFSKLRPAGSRLKTMGGKSSGPKPLRKLLHVTRQIILANQGKCLTNLQMHDLICHIGETVISGGVRRSAMISLSDLTDSSLRDAKQQDFFEHQAQRSMANNSAVYNDMPDDQTLLAEWSALANSGSGERGIFNRGGLLKTLPKRRIALFEKLGLIVDNQVTSPIGTNPCGEIILQNKQFCNLSEVVARPDDDARSLLHKIKMAALIGTYQATLTHFPFLSKEWTVNCEQERLLGVSITGVWDCPALQDKKCLQSLRRKAVAINKRYAKRFLINPATSVTCVKPSGTVSQLVDCAPGIHARFSPYYIRRIRIAASDALFELAKQQGIPYQPETGQSTKRASTFVLEFPIKAPQQSVCQSKLSAIDQLEHWLLIKQHYTEHNPSVTIQIATHEWIDVLSWLKSHWDFIGGLAFLPKFEHIYPLAPFETINRTEYLKRQKRLKEITFDQLSTIESQDHTELLREYACVGPQSPFC